MSKSTSPQGAAGNAIPTDIWETTGVTEHMGGVGATERLLDMCPLTPGQSVLVIGCGTGHTACLVARRSQAHVVALDASPRAVQEARQRVMREGLGEQVSVVQADAHCLPCSAGVFGAAVAESVLAFCRASEVAGEVHRVLQAEGAFAANELTLLAPPPRELVSLLQDRLGIAARQEAEWRASLAAAGFTGVEAAVRRIRLREQLASHLRVDGLGKWLASVRSGVGEASIRRAFFNREMLRAALRFVPYVGYGLYVGRKPGAQVSASLGDEKPGLAQAAK